MNINLKKLQKQYKMTIDKGNKAPAVLHTIFAENYDNLCMNYFDSQYNTFVAQQLAEQGLFANAQSEDVFVDWLNKE